MPRTQKSLRLGRVHSEPVKVLPTNVTVREAFAKLLTMNASKFGGWLTQVAEGHTYRVHLGGGRHKDITVAPDPGKALDLVIKIAEYHIPRLTRVAHTGPDEGPVLISVSPEDHQL